MATDARDPFSEFSKGAVVCKYAIVEKVGNHRARGRMGCLLSFVWMMTWILLPPVFSHYWINAALAFLPGLFGQLLFRIAYPYREVGMVTFRNSTMEFARDGEESWQVDLRDLKSMTVTVSIDKDFVAHYSGTRVVRAYRLSIQQGERVRAYDVLNEMHLTAEDRKQFMAIPPLLSTTLKTLGDRFKIRFYDAKGEESGLI